MIKYIVGGYVLFMLLYWIEADDSNAWTLAYYSAEKLMAASGFALLAYHVNNKRVQQVALYAASVCVFMFGYFIFCMFFGHDTIITVSSFLFYSIIMLYLIKR